MCHAVLCCASACRVDVLLKADQPSDRTYWISVGSQYRKGAPSGYGVIKYSGGSSSVPSPANIVTPGAAVDKKWTTEGAHAAMALHMQAQGPTWHAASAESCTVKAFASLHSCWLAGRRNKHHTPGMHTLRLLLCPTEPCSRACWRTHCKHAVTMRVLFIMLSCSLQQFQGQPSSPQGQWQQQQCQQQRSCRLPRPIRCRHHLIQNA